MVGITGKVIFSLFIIPAAKTSFSPELCLRLDTKNILNNTGQYTEAQGEAATRDPSISIIRRLCTINKDTNS